MTTAATPGAPLRVFAAGSLRAPLEDLAAQGGAHWRLEFAAAGLLRDRIAAGEPADAFASANLAHPRALAASGGWSEPLVFARNELCAIAAPGVQVDSDSLLDTLLDPCCRLGTSTPVADPSGDYAWAVFQRAEALCPGACDTLAAKALTVTGAADSPRPPPGRNTYAWVMAEHGLDLFLTYRTNAERARADWPALRTVELPAALAVCADYGVSWRLGAGAAAEAFARGLLAPAARATLAGHGFESP